MKKTFIILFVFGVLVTHARKDPEKKDSLRVIKNEIGFNTLPLISVLGGSVPGSNVRWAANYRRYIDEKNIFRVSLSVFPHMDILFVNGSMVFHQIADTFLIYKNYQRIQNPKMQVNIGYERVFRSRKLIHSFGVDLFANYQHSERKDRYYWIGKSADPAKSETFFEMMKNPVDTIGNVQTTDFIGIGLNPFYNIRLPISKHWIVSATVGAGFQIAYGTSTTTDRKTGKVTSDRVYNLDATGPLISDLSICYRF
jgi:hypothetical protein